MLQTLLTQSASFFHLYLVPDGPNSIDALIFSPLPHLLLRFSLFSMQHHRLQSHIAASPGGAGWIISDDVKRGKRRGSYNCGRCGLPKKGHVYHLRTPTSASATTPTNVSVSSFSSISGPSSVSAARQPPPRQPYSLRRALSFDDVNNHTNGFDPSELSDGEDPDLFFDPELDLDSFRSLANLLWEVLKRLPPIGLLSAARVCKGWRDTTRRLWRATEELKLRFLACAQLGFVASMLHKCPGVVKLTLKMERCGFCLIHQTHPDP